MSAAIDPAIVEIAERELTAGQLDVSRLLLQGQSQRSVSYRLDVARTTVADRFDAACRRLRAHGVRFAESGEPYLPQKATPCVKPKEVKASYAPVTDRSGVPASGVRQG